MQAVTGALTALAGNNLAGALASGASPYLATEIKKRVGEDNIAANAMAHAVLGAITAELNNQSALAGGVGAGGGELAARVIASQLFPGKELSALSESEKQQVSGLSQLAAGIAGGLAAGNSLGAVTGAQAGKNAVENNALIPKSSCTPLTCKTIVDPFEGGGGGIAGGGSRGGGGSTKPGQKPGSNKTESSIVPGGGLAAHEKAGGHLIERHVGKTETELLSRVSTGNVKTASTFTDRATAEAVTSKVIDSNQLKIKDYLSGTQKQYLELEYHSSTPIGISVSRGSTSVTPATNARVIIGRDPSMPDGYRIITGYPTQ